MESINEHSPADIVTLSLTTTDFIYCIIVTLSDLECPRRVGFNDFGDLLTFPLFLFPHFCFRYKMSQWLLKGIGDLFTFHKAP